MTEKNESKPPIPPRWEFPTSIEEAIWRAQEGPGSEQASESDIAGSSENIIHPMFVSDPTLKKEPSPSTFPPTETSEAPQSSDPSLEDMIRRATRGPESETPEES